MTWFWIPAGVAFGISWIVSGLVAKYGYLLKIIDDPKKHKLAKVVHEKAVPRGGGLPIFMAVVVGLLSFSAIDEKVIGIAAGCLILVITGWLDDRFEEKLSPYVRLFINVLAAGAVISAGIGIAYITNPWGGVIRLDYPQYCLRGHCLWIISDFFALLWLVWMQNIIGWSSGVDGQLPGFVIVASLTIAILGMQNGASSQTLVVILAVLIAGAYAGFLPWNWYPQKIMPGYGGKSLAGFLLGVLAILSGAKVGAMFLVLSMPFMDAVLVILKRFREGRSIFWGGREHLHHMLLDQKWSKPKIAFFYWIISLMMAVLALQLKATAKYFTMAAVVIALAGGIWWLQHLSIYSKRPDRDSGSKT
jgi:UDP-GlcNAc:undecaprenyl-phosphate/decaprenyl-phosphate GlcNAc-1-phosphate transferase